MEKIGGKISTVKRAREIHERAGLPFEAVLARQVVMPSLKVLADIYEEVTMASGMEPSADFLALESIRRETGACDGFNLLVHAPEGVRDLWHLPLHGHGPFYVVVGLNLGEALDLATKQRAKGHDCMLLVRE